MKEYDIRMIGLDLDGTTLTDDKVLTPHTKEVLEECLRRGIHVMAATGRTKKGLPDYLHDIEGMRYVVVSNGAVVYDMLEDKNVYENYMAWDEALRILDIVAEYTPMYDYYTGGEGIVTPEFVKTFEGFDLAEPIKDIIRRTIKTVPDIRTHLIENKCMVEKINMFFPTDAVKMRSYEQLRKHKEFTCVGSIPLELEITDLSCNKADALLNFGKLFGIERSQIMACGDGGNDRCMVEMAGLGVAMANADEEVKEVADFITLSNNEEGVAYAIEKFVLNK